MPTLYPLEIAGLRDTVVDTQLDHVCTLQRDQGGPADPYGEPADVWAALYTGIACHYWETAEAQYVGQVNATVTRERLVLPANTDVTTKDRVLSVTGVDALPIAGAMDILEVIDCLEHVVLTVKAVQ